MSKEVSRRDSKQPVPARHSAAMVAVGIVGVIIAFVVLQLSPASCSSSSRLPS